LAFDPTYATAVAAMNRVGRRLRYFRDAMLIPQSRSSPRPNVGATGTAAVRGMTTNASFILHQGARLVQDPLKAGAELEADPRFGAKGEAASAFFS